MQCHKRAKIKTFVLGYMGLISGEQQENKATLGEEETLEIKGSAVWGTREMISPGRISLV